MKIDLSGNKRSATRESYAKELVALGKEHDDLYVLDADLAGATKTSVFQKEFPDRHIDCGIAEADMMGIAAGMSTTGIIPFASTFAMFAAGRAYEQIRNSIGYPHLNVKIAATHAGISVGEDGATHQCCEDIALMRTIPGMVVLNPCDEVEARAAIRAAYLYKGPVYIRLGRLAIPVIFDEDDYSFEIGKGILLKEGKDITIFATGLEVYESLIAAQMLEKDGINAEVIDIHTIKPIDRDIITESLKKTGRAVTVEEHSVIGGLYGAVCEVAASECPCRIEAIGINDTFGHSGPAMDLIKEFGLDGESVYNKIKSLF